MCVYMYLAIVRVSVCDEACCGATAAIPVKRLLRRRRELSPSVVLHESVGRYLNAFLVGVCNLALDPSAESRIVELGRAHATPTSCAESELVC